MNESIRNLFIAARNYTYLNSAAVSPLPETAVGCMTAPMRMTLLLVKGNPPTGSRGRHPQSTTTPVGLRRRSV